MTKTFTIMEVENLTMIKAATLRIWEKRYNFCKPERSNNNRLYTLTDLEVLIHISQLKDNGYSISKLASLDVETILKKASELQHAEEKYRYAVNRLIISMFALDIDAFNNHVNRYFALFGVQEALGKVVMPFLEKITHLYASKTYNEVLLAITSIRGKLIYCIESLEFKRNSDKSAVLFLPKNEHFDLILLYVCYLLKSEGYKTIYMGTNIPEENIMIILKQNKPDQLFTYVADENNLNMPLLLSYITKMHPGKKLNVISGSNTSLSMNHKIDAVNFISHQQFSKQLQIA